MFDGGVSSWLRLPLSLEEIDHDLQVVAMPYLEDHPTDHNWLGALGVIKTHL